MDFFKSLFGIQTKEDEDKRLIDELNRLDNERSNPVTAILHELKHVTQDSDYVNFGKSDALALDVTVDGLLPYSSATVFVTAFKKVNGEPTKIPVAVKHTWYRVFDSSYGNQEFLLDKNTTNSHVFSALDVKSYIKLIVKEVEEGGRQHSCSVFFGPIALDPRLSRHCVLSSLDGQKVPLDKVYFSHQPTLSSQRSRDPSDVENPAFYIFQNSLRVSGLVAPLASDFRKKHDTRTPTPVNIKVSLDSLINVSGLHLGRSIVISDLDKESLAEIEAALEKVGRSPQHQMSGGPVGHLVCEFQTVLDRDKVLLSWLIYSQFRNLVADLTLHALFPLIANAKDGGIEQEGAGIVFGKKEVHQEELTDRYKLDLGNFGQLNHGLRKQNDHLYRQILWQGEVLNRLEREIEDQRLNFKMPPLPNEHAATPGRHTHQDYNFMARDSVVPGFVELHNRPYQSLPRDLNLSYSVALDG